MVSKFLFKLGFHFGFDFEFGCTVRTSGGSCTGLRRLLQTGRRRTQRTGFACYTRPHLHHLRPRKHIARRCLYKNLKNFISSQVCTLLNEGDWTVERDDDLTGTVAYSGDQWIAMDDDLAARIKVSCNTKFYIQIWSDKGATYIYSYM